jgi:hypothetical protein
VVAWHAPAASAAPQKPDTNTDDPEKTVNGRLVNAFDIGYLFVPKETTKDFEVWPENWRTWSLFRDMRTQWRRVGMSGAAYGLDYGVLFARMDRMRLSDHEYEETFSLIKHMECAALDEMNRDNE